MLDQMRDIGEDLYRSWSDEQRQLEIGRLVEGYKNGLPIQILCHLATTIAGSSDLACGHLSKFLSVKERKAIIKKEGGSNKVLIALLKETLLPR